MKIYVVNIEDTQPEYRFFRTTSGVKNFVGSHPGKSAVVMEGIVEFMDDVTTQFVKDEPVIDAPWT